MNQPFTYAIDLELSTPVLKGEMEAPPGIECAYGFNDHDNMRIASLCVVEVWNRCAPMVFLEDNLAEFKQLITPDVVFVSHNGRRFDCRVLENLHYDHLGLVIPPYIHVDIWDLCNKATGRFISLDRLAAANLEGAHKAGDSALIPYKWNQGRKGEVVAHNLQDCFLTAELFKLIVRDGYLQSPYGGQVVLKYKPNRELFRI